MQDVIPVREHRNVNLLKAQTNIPATVSSKQSVVHDGDESEAKPKKKKDKKKTKTNDKHDSRDIKQVDVDLLLPPASNGTEKKDKQIVDLTTPETDKKADKKAKKKKSSKDNHPSKETGPAASPIPLVAVASQMSWKSLSSDENLKMVTLYTRRVALRIIHSNFLISLSLAEILRRCSTAGSSSSTGLVPACQSRERPDKIDEFQHGGYGQCAADARRARARRRQTSFRNIG